uniref:Zinc finger/binuclear cluster transcriptional regulator n=1 Tax=Mycena chlorophos TaxID=658473 RepID=A0ABQ0LD17_MYCCL|nr:zinc finger/binuclear cluster transcriptional regulator [Mycena chlorophos]
MRSHTGDRPYKCVHCGDQFARSDLLSRHVNKCHAGASKPAAAGGRRKGTTAASRATTSKQACDQCVQSSLPCDGSNPCGKCISRKTRCTFVKFHRQTAPVGPGHATSLSASLPTPSSLANYGLHGPSSGAPPPFLYAQSAASGAGFAYSSPAPLNASPTATSAPPYPVPPGSREGIPFAHPPHGHGHFAPDYRDGYEYDRYDYDNGLDASSEHSGSVSTGSRPASSAGLSDYAGYHHNLQGSHSRQASLDMHSHHPGLDMQHHHPHSRPPAHDPHGRPPEFSSAFGLMSLDDPNVLAGLANDGVPFFSTNSPVAAHAQPHDKRLPPPIPLQLPLLPAPPPLQFHPQSQAGGTREAETRELREFWKAYMRTPLTGPSPGTAASNNDPLAHGLSLGLGLGMQTPSASANNAAVAAAAAAGGMLAVPNSGPAYAGNGPTPRRHRVSSLPSVRTPEGEIDARMVFPTLPPTHTHHQHPPIPPPPPVSVSVSSARTMHNADDLRSYEAAVLARKAPELVLRKPAKRDRGSPPTTTTTNNNTGQPPAPAQSQSPPQPHSQFDFNAMSRESSLAGAFGGKSFGYGSGSSVSALPPPPRTGSGSSTSNPASPLPHTPSSSDDGGDPHRDYDHEHEVESSVGSAHDDSDHDSGASSIGRPSFKRLPSQTLEPVYAKRRREYVPRHGGLTLGLDTPTQDGGAAYVYAHAERNENGNGDGNGKPPSSRQRGRRLSAPASPTALGFVIN